MTGTVLVGGTVADGTGAEPKRMDVRFDSSGILALGAGIERDGDRIVRADGLTVMPGFIDTHVHGAALLQSREHADDTIPLLAQGITTVILGGDGFAHCGGNSAALEFNSEYFGGIDGPPPSAVDGSLSSLLDSYDAYPVNVALLIPANTVRYGVLGLSDRDPTAQQLEQMVQLVREGMDAGALGLATGLEYVPGRFASDSELAALCIAVSDAGGIHASHMRGYGAALGEGLASLARIRDHSGVATHVAHLRAPAQAALAALDGEFTFDSYPYQRGCTLLSMKVLPVSTQTAGLAATLAFLASDDAIPQFALLEPQVGGYVLSSSSNSRWSQYAGSTLASAADAASLSVAETVRSLLLESRLSATCIIPGSLTDDSENDYSLLLQDPRQMACSDGIYVGEHPHPRGWGAFARVLSRHVRDRRDLTLGQAAAHLSGKAASTFGLAGRGVIAVGNHADLVVLDSERVADRAGYESPRVLAQGVENVFVNGVEVFAGGRATGARPGQAVRRGMSRAA